MNKFKENDEQLDVLLDKIIGGLSSLNTKVNKIGEAIEEQKDKIVVAQKGVDRNLLQLRQKNGEMKEILTKFKTNTQCCMNVIIIIVFLGLISVIIAILRTKRIF